ncbi:hypothetical protein CPC08DRAFT_534801 [Agrocybe pediades]|nr:hypothetical protein CPC08DRAFT_534801 [Agrocybe pediades]
MNRKNEGGLGVDVDKVSAKFTYTQPNAPTTSFNASNNLSIRFFLIFGGFFLSSSGDTSIYRQKSSSKNRPPQPHGPWWWWRYRWFRVLSSVKNASLKSFCPWISALPSRDMLFRVLFADREEKMDSCHGRAARKREIWEQGNILSDIESG